MFKNQLTITVCSDDRVKCQQWAECAAILRNIATQLDRAQAGNYSGHHTRAQTAASIGDWYITQPS